MLRVDHESLQRVSILSISNWGLTDLSKLLHSFLLPRYGNSRGRRGRDARGSGSLDFGRLGEDG